MTAPLRATLGLLAALASAPAMAVAADAPASAGIPWVNDWKTAQKQARASGRPVLVDFWAEWCHWCHELDRTTYVDPDVVALAGGFVAVKVNAEGSLGELELARRYEVSTLPTIAFVSARGRLLVRRTAFENAETFTASLRTAARVAAEAAPWEEALAKNEKDARALAGLGELMLFQAQVGEADALLARARRVDGARPVPERRRTRELLAQIALHQGRRDESRRLKDEADALGEAPDGATSGAAETPRSR
jgi:thioredoxin-like negative regulator of GroEL